MSEMSRRPPRGVTGDRRRWPLSFKVIAALGATATGALGWVGAQMVSPDARLAALERYDVVRSQYVDSLFAARQRAVDSQFQNQNMRIAILTELTTMLVAMRCTEDDPGSVAAARRARVPCARILREQGIDR